MGTDGFFDVLHSTRSIRRLRQDPVPDEILVKLVEAGIRGPSAANARNWHFVVVRDRQMMKRIAEPWRRGSSFFAIWDFWEPSRLVSGRSEEGSKSCGRRPTRQPKMCSWRRGLFV